MKRFTIFLAFIYAAGAAYALNGGTLTVTSVVSTPVTGITVITYDLQIGAKAGASYNIAVDASFNNGLSYLQVPPAHLSGDVMGVTPGTGKQITWNGAAGFPNRYSTETKVRLTATSDVFVCGVSTVRFMYNGSSVTYGTVVGANGKCWLDRNLGASQVATSSDDAASYGDLFQWGRFAEGHQIRANTVHYSGPVSTSVPNEPNAWDGKFITNGASPYDWLSTQDANLWQGVNGVNNPCPPGYRVPTLAEWDAERLSWAPNNNSTGAFASPLKLPVAGYRSVGHGSLSSDGSRGDYWSSTVDGLHSRFLHFISNDALMGNDGCAYGLSVRCIKH